MFNIVQTASPDWSKVDHDWNIYKLCVNEDERGQMNSSMGAADSLCMVLKHELKFSYSGILAIIVIILHE